MPEIKLKENQVERLTTKPDSTTLAVIDSIPSAFIGTDQNNKMQVYPAFMYDNVTGKAFGSTNPNIVSVADPSIPSRIVAVSFMQGDLSGGILGLDINALQRIANLTSAQCEVVRTPTIFKNVAAAAAPATTDLWAPTAGKKFRLLGGVITMAGTIAAAAARTLQLIEETAGTVIVEVHLSIAALGSSISVPFTIVGNGYLSSTVTKKLQIVTAGGTYVTGTDAVSVWGTEE